MRTAALSKSTAEKIKARASRFDFLFKRAQASKDSNPIEGPPTEVIDFAAETHPFLSDRQGDLACAARVVHCRKREVETI